MRFSYEQLLSPNPITIVCSIGGQAKAIHLRKPKLSEIDAEIGFDNFRLYELFITLTPKTYYEEFAKDLPEDKKEKWFNLPTDEKLAITTFDLVKEIPDLREIYCSIFGYFFNSKFLYDGEYNIFITLNDASLEYNSLEEVNIDDIKFFINEKTFPEILGSIGSTCYIQPKEGNGKVKFRNKIAQKIYEKCQMNELNKKPKQNKNESIGNIISKVSNRHQSLNPITIWDLTFFQLIDSFRTLQIGENYDMNKMAVSVWGDKENKFDSSLWYKNTFE